MHRRRPLAALGFSPGTSFVVLEALESFGGTWLMHRYPGIRSDSDLYTFGYRFKPRKCSPIATAAEIRGYMGEVIDENDLGRRIRYGHKIASASMATHPSGRGWRNSRAGSSTRRPGRRIWTTRESTSS